MATVAPTSPSKAAGWGAWILAGLFLVIAALIFGAIWFEFPSSGHWYGLVYIGVIGILFALGSYLAEAASREPMIQRSLAWGFFGFGFAVLLFTIGVGNLYGVLTLVWVLLGLVVVLAVLFITVGLMMWRVRSVAATAAREAPRQAWRNEPTPSALTYAAANSPSVPAVTPPPAPQNPPPRNP